MKRTLLPLVLLLALFAALPAQAKAPYHGNFIICSNEDLTIKMTADLSDGKGEKVATAVQNGIKMVFPETTNKKGIFDFKFYPMKTTPLIVAHKGERIPEIVLVRNTKDEEQPQVLFDQKDPLIYRMIKFKAFLSLKSFDVKGSPVTCTESKWESD